MLKKSVFPIFLRCFFIDAIGIVHLSNFLVAFFFCVEVPKALLGLKIVTGKSIYAEAGKQQKIYTLFLRFSMITGGNESWWRLDRRKERPEKFIADDACAWWKRFFLSYNWATFISEKAMILHSCDSTRWWFAGNSGKHSEPGV